MFRLEFPIVLSLGLILLFAGCDQQSVAPPVVTIDTDKPETATDNPSAEPIAAAEQTRQAEVKSTPSNKSAPSSQSVDSQPVYPTLARNPFQPPNVTVRTLMPHQIQTADIRLLGIAKRDSQRFVIVENGGELSKAAIGEPIGDWEVTRIGETEVKLRRGLEEILLKLN